MFLSGFGAIPPVKTNLNSIGIVLLALSAWVLTGQASLALSLNSSLPQLEPPELSEYEPDIEPGVPAGPGSGSR
ncbi:hypothetical protein E1H12_04975 [Geitlerinema sp. P-1104]|nr:hypothetical protein [Geitlerinema sp. P-1104]